MRWMLAVLGVAICAFGATAQESTESATTGTRYCPDGSFSLQLVQIYIDGTRDEVFDGRFQAARQLVGDAQLKGLDVGLEFVKVDKDPGCFAIERKLAGDAPIDPNLTSIRLVYEEGGSRTTIDYDPNSASSITQVDSADVR